MLETVTAAPGAAAALIHVPLRTSILNCLAQLGNPCYHHRPSSAEEFGPGTAIQRYIPEAKPEGFAAPEEVARHILYSGQVYYTLLAEREKRGLKNIAISRVEQISPLPYDMITPHLDWYPNAITYWVQEEPINNGAWTYVQPRLETAMRETEHHSNRRVYYTGRGPTSSVATGSKKQHALEIEQFCNAAFDLDAHVRHEPHDQSAHKKGQIFGLVIVIDL